MLSLSMTESGLPIVCNGQRYLCNLRLLIYRSAWYLWRGFRLQRCFLITTTNVSVCLFEFQLQDRTYWFSSSGEVSTSND